MTHNGNLILCHSSGQSGYFFSKWYKHTVPVMRESAIEIDQLLQDWTVKSRSYDLVVFKFTPEQEEKILIQKLRGIK